MNRARGYRSQPTAFSEVYKNKVKDLKAVADKSSEQGKICKVDNKSSREYAELELNALY